MALKICVITGTRADYGHLLPLLTCMKSEAAISMQLVATAMHLSPEFGLTVNNIIADGFSITDKVEMPVSSDAGSDIAKSMGLGTQGFADSFKKLTPDLIVIFGDRFEMLAAAQAALVMKIPVAHIGGGDITEGAYDDALRHCLTKLSHIHFVTNDEAHRRVLQLGEQETNVHNVGSLCIDSIQAMSLLSKVALEKEIDFAFRRKNVLVTYHPTTLASQSSVHEIDNLLRALNSLGQETGIIFTKANLDSGGFAITERIEAFIAKSPNAKFYNSLGQKNYYSCVSVVDAVVGNSSSGIYEVPSFKKPTVNIGDRQKGRPQASSIINCAPEQEAIKQAIEKAYEHDCSQAKSPYGEGNTAPKIVKLLSSLQNPRTLLSKHFCDRAS